MPAFFRYHCYSLWSFETTSYLHMQPLRWRSSAVFPCSLWPELHSRIFKRLLIKLRFCQNVNLFSESFVVLMWEENKSLLSWLNRPHSYLTTMIRWVSSIYLTMSLEAEHMKCLEVNLGQWILMRVTERQYHNRANLFWRENLDTRSHSWVDCFELHR